MSKLKCSEHPPFKILGFNDGYYSYSIPNLIKLTANQHTQSNLMVIASLAWWEKWFPCKKGVDWNAARNFMFRVSKNNSGGCV